MLRLMYEFPTAAKIPKPHAIMFNAPARTTLPGYWEWNPGLWNPIKDAQACESHLRDVPLESRAIVFPWAYRLEFMPQDVSPKDHVDRLVRMACARLEKRPSIWQAQYFEPFIAELHRRMGDSPAPLLVFDNEKGFKAAHLYPHEEEVYRRLRDYTGMSRAEIIGVLDREPNATIRRGIDFVRAFWPDVLAVNFWDNGTDLEADPQPWKMWKRDSVTDCVSCPVFYLRNDRLLAKYLKMAETMYKESPRSLPVLWTVGTGGQPEAVLRSLAKGLYDIGFWRAWMFNPPGTNQTEQDEQTCRAVSEATA